MNISYAILACNEIVELERLLSQLKSIIIDDDEIVVLLDEGNYDPGMLDLICRYGAKVFLNPLNNDFAQQKNYLFSKCIGDYIVNLDADELLSEYLAEFIHDILDCIDPAIQTIAVPRINTVTGLTQAYIDKWGWRVDDNGYVNFPDYQRRIVKNDGKSKWERPVHEVLVGWKRGGQFPAEADYCIIHPKSIDRQVKQNDYYETI